MPGTPSPLKLGFQRNSYSRVSFGNNQEQTTHEQEQITQLLTDNGVAGGKVDSERSPLKPDVDYINPGADGQMEVYGYCKHMLKTLVTWLLIVATGGILRLIFHWTPHWLLLATHTRCALASAEKVLLVEQYQERHKCYHVKTVSTLTVDKFDKVDDLLQELSCDNLGSVEVDVGGQPDKLSVHLSGGVFKEVEKIRVFACKKLNYVWDEERGEFFQLRGLDKDVSTSVIHQSAGLTKQQQYLRRVVYGANEIIVPVRTVMTLLVLEVLNPFYVFQVFSFCLWFADDYVYYAIAILVMSSSGIIMSIVQTRKNQSKLRSTVHSTDVATVIRGLPTVTDVIPTEQLVPGDLLLVPAHGCIMHCDAVLITGNCIVNESMLTGESVPVTKTPLPNTSLPFDCKEHSKHTLFCGTHVIQTRYYGNQRVLAVVIRTGFATAKGELVRSIMYPPPVDFKFEHDSYKFVEMLAGIASVGFIYTVVTKYMRGMSASEIALDALDLITIVVPPALPAAMTVGRFYAQNRLQAKDIYCISPRTINVSGSIDCVCFDKTGTLTEDGLDMWGVIPIAEQKFLVPVKSVNTLEIRDFLVSLATCHSLTIIDNKLSGDPLDLKMFECTHWTLEEPEVNDSSKFDIIFPSVVKPPKTDKIDSDVPAIEIGIVRQFPFSSSLQRMSVITRQLGAVKFQVFCKGSPEMILTLAKPESVPLDFSSTLEEYTQEGYRVLAVAYKDLKKISYTKVERLTREEVESRLTLLGLVVMENRLKPETADIIGMLNQAAIRNIMVTGDNMLTALSVARDCGIVGLKEKVIIAQASPPQGDKPAQLVFSNSASNLLPPHDMMVGDYASDMNNSSSVTSFDAFVRSPPDSPSKHAATHDGYSFALTGHTWGAIRTYFPDVLARIATRGAVFARMSPDQKQQLVQELQVLGYYVAMCGDGANDCGALKAAHAGISLSEAESSVASPFTSKQANISCVPHVIREGRAALVTSFGIFKYMAAYSLTQFVSVMLLYSIDTNLTDKQFLFIDLFLITLFAFFFGRTEAFSGPLVKSPPILSLISLAPILSLLSQMVIVVSIQWLAFYSIQQPDWFVPYNSTSLTRGLMDPSYENYAVFSVSSLQYIILAVVFSKGAPYRKSILNNYGFSISLVILTCFTTYVIVSPFEWLQVQFGLKMPPTVSFRLVMVGLGFCNLVIACFVEYFFIDYVIAKKFRRRKHKKVSKSRQYLNVDLEMRKDPSWPPISCEPFGDATSAVSERPPRSPAEISVVERNGAVVGGSRDVEEVAARKRVKSAVEVTLNPADLVDLPKRRHYSETEMVQATYNGGVSGHAKGGDGAH